MMRQLGGSFGIAIITTFISRFNQQHRVALLSHLNGSDFKVQQRIVQMQHSFMAKGFSFDVSLKKPIKALNLQ